MKALIAAGGRSTRMRPITHTRNKHLIPLANRPMLEYVIDKIVEAGITDIIINVNIGEVEIMKNAFGDGSRWNAKITYVEQQGGARGIAHAVANAEEYLRGEPFVFFLGDNVMVGSIKRMRDRFEAEQLDCMIGLSRVKDPNRFGVAEFNADGSLKRAVEKPKEAPSPFAITGIYFFNQRYFEAFKTLTPSTRGEFEITDIITWYIQNGKVGHDEITGWWKDTGTPAALLEGNALVLDEMLQEDIAPDVEMGEDCTIQGCVRIGKGSKIGPNVLIRGPVVLGENCTIDHTYIGPYTSVGNGATVSGSDIEHSIVLAHATIVGASRIVDSLIGENARVTPASQTLPRGHRLVIGDQSVVEL